MLYEFDANSPLISAIPSLFSLTTIVSWICVMIKEVINKYKFYYYCRRAYHRLILFRVRNNSIPKDFIRKKVIFIHIPKSAGNAITRSLFNTESMNLGGHSSALHYFEADESSFNSCFKFSFSRHPVSRFISAFNFLKNGGIT